ncbi:hypothetical protein EW146_g8440 [Bondarzewia mesenterica]|uniref:Uncharacterized protein n=1 Tax=Bondarzewia mesenterica TaxID=1095465 RepID=A0A4V6S1A6_9AGAM|nr:hypothetical protein EW146_g8440 [Bondarzewia mesenterica]
MTSLPSFVELMASLGLEDEASFPHFSPVCCRPRSSSNATSSSSTQDDEPASPRQQHHPTGKYLLVPSHHTRSSSAGIDLDLDVPSVSRRGRGRYAPYSAAHVSDPPVYLALPAT